MLPEEIVVILIKYHIPLNLSHILYHSPVLKFPELEFHMAFVYLT